MAFFEEMWADVGEGSPAPELRAGAALNQDAPAAVALDVSGGVHAVGPFGQGELLFAPAAAVYDAAPFFAEARRVGEAVPVDVADGLTAAGPLELRGGSPLTMIPS